MRSILVLNAGSSSIKFALYPAASDGGDNAGCHGEIEGIGHRLHLKAHDRAGQTIADQRIDGPANHHQGLAGLLDWLAAR